MQRHLSSLAADMNDFSSSLRKTFVGDFFPFVAKLARCMCGCCIFEECSMYLSYKDTAGWLAGWLARATVQGVVSNDLVKAYGASNKCAVYSIPLNFMLR